MTNDCTFPASDSECVVAILAMAAGEMPGDEFTDWVRIRTRIP